MNTPSEGSAPIGSPFSHPRSSASSAERKARVSLTIVVRDEEKNLRTASSPWRASSTRSSWSIPAAPTGPGRSPARSAAGVRLRPRSTTAPQPATRPWTTPRAITRSGWTPTRWLIRRNGRSCGRCWMAWGGRTGGGKAPCWPEGDRHRRWRSQSPSGSAIRAGGSPDGDRHRRPRRSRRGQAPASMTGASPLQASPFGQSPAYAVRRQRDPGPAGAGVRPRSIRSGCSRFARISDGRVGSTSRSCRHCGGPARRCGRRTSPSGHGLSRSAPRARKLDRDARILQDELKHRPDDPFTLFHLGSIAIERERWREALGFLNQSRAGSAPGDSIMPKLSVLIAQAHQGRKPGRDQY